MGARPPARKRRGPPPPRPKAVGAPGPDAPPRPGKPSPQPGGLCPRPGKPSPQPGPLPPPREAWGPLPPPPPQLPLSLGVRPAQGPGRRTVAPAGAPGCGAPPAPAGARRSLPRPFAPAGPQSFRAELAMGARASRARKRRPGPAAAIPCRCATLGSRELRWPVQGPCAAREPPPAEVAGELWGPFNRGRWGGPRWPSSCARPFAGSDGEASVAGPRPASAQLGPRDNRGGPSGARRAPGYPSVSSAPRRRKLRWPVQGPCAAPGSPPAALKNPAGGNPGAMGKLTGGGQDGSPAAQRCKLWGPGGALGSGRWPAKRCKLWGPFNPGSGGRAALQALGARPTGPRS